MFYVQAEKNDNGSLRIDTIPHFVDESLAYDESNFLKACTELDNNEMVQGIVSDDIYEILQHAYPY